MEFRWHPILEGLKINEDGTEIIYNDVRDLCERSVNPSMKLNDCIPELHIKP